VRICKAFDAMLERSISLNPDLSGVSILCRVWRSRVRLF